MAVDESTRAIQDLDSLHLRNKNVKNAKLLDQQRVKLQEGYETALYDLIVENVVEKMLPEYHGRVNYFCHRVNNERFGVFRKEYKTYSRDPIMGAEFKGYMVPKFAWVWTVKISAQEILQNNDIQHELSLHQPVQHEESLSQYAEQVDDIFVCEEIQIGDTSHCNGFPMTICINSPINEQVRQNRVAIAQGGGAYNNMMPLFQQMTNLADTDPYLYGFVWQSLMKPWHWWIRRLLGDINQVLKESSWRNPVLTDQESELSN